MSYNFREWLNVQPANKEYSFHDCTGKCAVGQYMASRGEKWHFEVYNDHIAKVGKPHEVVGALASSKTFGELKAKLELV